MKVPKNKAEAAWSFVTLLQKWHSIPWPYSFSQGGYTLSQIQGEGNQTPIPNGRMARSVIGLHVFPKKLRQSTLEKKRNKTTSHISHLFRVRKYLAGGIDNGYVTKCVSLMLLSCTFKMVEVANFMVYIFCHHKKIREGGKEGRKKGREGEKEGKERKRERKRPRPARGWSQVGARWEIRHDILQRKAGFHVRVPTCA